MSYDAFISYSHGADSEVAEALERALGRFSKPWYRRRALRVFRDTSSLSASPGLWSSITAAMDDSDFLVVCCSPESAQSSWVEREIEHWCTTKPADQILLVLTGGEMVWNGARNEFDADTSTAVPAVLAAAFTEEPLYVDMRAARGAPDLTLDNPGFADQIADLAAPMHGVAKDELIGEEIRQHKRTLRVAAFAVLALAFLSVAAVAGAVVAKNQSDTARARLADNVRLNGTVAENERRLATLDRDVLAKEEALANAEEKTAAAESETEAARGQISALEVDIAATERLSELAAERAQILGAQVESAQVSLASANSATEGARLEQLRAEAKLNTALAEVSALGTSEALAKQRAAAFNEQATQAEAKAATATKTAATAAAEAAKQTDIAKQQRAAAATAAAEAVAAQNAQNAALATAQAAELATAAADTAAGQLDLSLLLANEATRVTPETSAPAGQSARAVASVEPGVETRAYSALLTGVENSASVHGFLQFEAGTAPQALDHVAVSPDGSYIAAVETSNVIQATSANARLYVWHADDPTTVTARLLSSSLRCVSDLEWTADNNLITVENPDGCLNPILVNEFAGIHYVATVVRSWDPTTAVKADLVVANGLNQHGFFGYSTFGTSPVSLSADGRRVVVSYVGLDEANNLLVFTLWLDTETDNADISLAEPFSLYGGDAFSPSGRYALGFDWLTGLPTLWDFEQFDPEPACDSFPFESHPTGCFRAIAPSDPGVHPLGLKVTGDDEHFAVASADSERVLFFSTATGDARPEYTTAVADDIVRSFALSNDRVAISGANNETIHRWRDADDEPVPVIASPGDCSFAPDLAPTSDLLFLTRLCSEDVLNDVSTVVVDTATGATLGEPRGRVVFSDAAGYVVTQRLDLRAAVPHYSMELWRFPIVDGQRTRGTLIDVRSDGKPAVAPDGSLVATFHPGLAGAPEGVVEVWHLTPDGVVTATLPGSVHVRDVAFRGGNEVVGVGRMPSGVVWDPARAGYDLRFPADDPQPCDGARDHHDTALRSAVSSDDSTRAVSYDGRTVQLVTLDGGPTTNLALPLQPSERIDYLSFTRNGRAVLVNLETPPPGPLADDDFKCRYGVPTGSLVVQLRDANNATLATPAITRFAETARRSSDDGERILFEALDHRSLVVRDADTLANVAPAFSVGVLTPNIDPQTRFTIDRDGRRIGGTNTRGTTVVWTLEHGSYRPGASRTPPGGVQPTARLDFDGLAFSPDGNHLAVKTVDQRLVVWDLTTPGAVPQVRQLENDAAARVVYSPDSRLIAVDGTYLFEASTLARIGPRLRPAAWNDPVYDIGTIATRFVEKGDALYLVVERTGDTSAARYRIDLDYLRDTACARAGRNLTADEFALYRISGVFRPTPCGSREGG